MTASAGSRSVPGAEQCVADASAIAKALTGKSTQMAELRDRLRGMLIHAPHLVDAEVGNVLRRHERAGLISAGEAQAALVAAHVIIAQRYPHTGPLARAAWALRHNLTFYDALYAALAAALRVPLWTADARLANAPGLPCEVELV